MQERFSDRARHSMALANLEATKLNHDYLAPGHLMLGLIAEGNCVATETLRVLDVNLEKVRDEVQSHLERGTATNAIGWRAQTQELKDVIALAIEEARKFGHRYVGTEHLVLGLLAKEESLPAKVLSRQGASIHAVREKALGMLHGSVDPSHDLAHSRHGDFEWVHQQELAKAFRSPKFWHTMILAVDSANRLGDGEIRPHHLLLALMRDESTGVGAMLAEKGVTLDWLRGKVASNNNGRAEGR